MSKKKEKSLTGTPFNSDYLKEYGLTTVTRTRDPDKAYLIVGSGYLGVDVEKMQPLAVYANYHNMQVIHAGPLVTQEELSMYRFRQKKIKTFEKYGSIEETLPDDLRAVLEQGLADIFAGVSLQDIDWEDYADEELSSSELTALSQAVKAMLQKADIIAEMKAIEQAQQSRVEALKDLFEEVTFIHGANDVVVPVADSLGSSLMLSPYIGVTAMMANGPKITHWPITARTLKALSSMKHSWILPHPIIQAESFAKPGLNNADNYFTTGRLSAPTTPTHTSEIYQSKHLMGGVSVFIDKDGSFFASNLILETSDRGETFILEDGDVFTEDGDFSADDLAMSMTDSHGPYEQKGVMALYQVVAGDLGPSTHINGGDTGDMSSVSRHATGKPGQIEGKRLKADLDAIRRILSAQGGSDTTNILIDSNHHEWLTQFLDYNPQLKGMLDWETISKGYPDWRFLLRKAGEDEIYNWYDMTYRHGDKESPEQGEKIFGKYCGGHYHRYRRLGQTVSFGPACGLGPEYLGGALTAWQSQIGTHSAYKGKVQTSAKTVIRRGDSYKTVVAGQIFEVELIGEYR